MKFNKHIVIFFTMFSVIFMLSFSFPFQVLPNIGGWFETFFNKLATFVGHQILGFSIQDLTYHSGEDSLGMLINLFNVLLISLILYALVAWRFSQKLEAIVPFCLLILRYFLALILLIYGFDKIYKYQFYYPEPNILYTRLKDIPQDLLYWSTMGTSYSYSFFAGMMEVVPAVLLLWRRTYVLGGIVAFLVFLNVFMTNVGFDITIKIFSFFLCCCVFVLLLPNLTQLVRFYQGQESKLVPLDFPFYTTYWYKILKVLILLLFIIEPQYKYFSNMNFNDDRWPRPKLHGAFEVIDSLSSPLDWRMIYFHRKGYFVIENGTKELNDAKMTIDTDTKSIHLTNYQGETQHFNYSLRNDTLFLESNKLHITAVQVYKYSSNPN